MEEGGLASVMRLYPDEQGSDLEIVSRMARHEAEAFTVFYDRHAPMIFGLLCRMLGDRPEAEDALQETFWQIWRQAAAHDPARGSPLAWLVQIARSRGLDRLRQTKLRARRDGGPVEVLHDRLRAENATDIEVMARENQQMIHKTLSGLPPDQRKAITLAYFDGLTHMEIAERLQTPLGTIKTRIRLGMRKLQETFQEAKKNDESGLRGI
ncbi:MAG: sigma-70 family RNA polymerase sigma factor [Acidobacteria bacterium]|nr:sigma-70 family RNA polymerase sigma factor [Acidobacteriota bacterium]MBI3658071.1 sigma-70 family RNA polymerase sigma factor [Acidobacteriota bacterium]